MLPRMELTCRETRQRFHIQVEDGKGNRVKAKLYTLPWPPAIPFILSISKLNLLSSYQSARLH